MNEFLSGVMISKHPGFPFLNKRTKTSLQVALSIKFPKPSNGL